MSVTTAELAYCMTLPPKRAINYLKSKGYQITWDWEEMWQEAHARAFTVAKVTRLDILEDIRGHCSRLSMKEKPIAGSGRSWSRC
ncbi:putative head morphogenesis protein of bacteriophage [Escherichia coli]|nr:putative head morphogenesis protein of bacteriophage [Escherichia coli]